MTTIVLTSGTRWTVPSDWNNAGNKIECIGGGGGGGLGQGAGGGAGAYTFLEDVALTPGTVVPIVIGQGGAGRTAGGTGSDFGAPGTATNFNSGQVVADCGGHAFGIDQSLGGYWYNCVPTAAAHNGGDSGPLNLLIGGAGGGGGGAGGPHGQGGSGGIIAESDSGSGAGGADGGANVPYSAPGVTEHGGAAFDGTPGGLGGTSASPNGGNGANGSGGGGGYSSGGSGGSGSTEPLWFAGSVWYGPGSGGGSGGGPQIGGTPEPGPGGAGARFGGGGGAGNPGGNGAHGAIIITYPGSAPPPPPPPIPLRRRTYRHRLLGWAYKPSITVIKDRPGALRIIEFSAWMD